MVQRVFAGFKDGMIVMGRHHRLLDPYASPEADSLVSQPAKKHRYSKKLSLTKSVALPLTVGEKLRRARLKKGLDLLEVEHATLIRAKYLEALEQSKFYLLPLPVYTCGFVQSYAAYLGLNPKKLMAQFRQEYGLASRASVNNLTLDTRIEAVKWVITPKLLWGSILGMGILALLTYLVMQVVGFTSAPTLVIDSPSQQAEIQSQSITVSGSTDPGAIVTIGEQKVLVDESGHFNEDVHAQLGVNTIPIKTTGRSGRSRLIVRTVTVKEPRAALVAGEGNHE